MAKEQKASGIFGGTTVNVHLANADALFKIQATLDAILAAVQKQADLGPIVDQIKSQTEKLHAAVTANAPSSGN